MGRPNPVIPKSLRGGWASRRLAPTIFALLFSACAVKKLSFDLGNPKWGLDVTWHGHSCFTLEDSVGRTVVIDPFDETVGYGRINLRADALFITHNHFDHNNRRAVKPRLQDIDLAFSTGTATVASGLQVTGLPAAHDKEEGQINGPNSIYIFVMGGLRCVHLGDIGTPVLTDFQKKMIGKVDVLFVPVGGITTTDAAEAKKLVDELNPSVVFPMHYGDIRFFRLRSIEEFTQLFSVDQIRNLNDAHVRVRESDLTDKPVVYILTATPKNY